MTESGTRKIRFDVGWAEPHARLLLKTINQALPTLQSAYKQSLWVTHAAVMPTGQVIRAVNFIVNKCGFNAVLLNHVF